MQESVIIKLDKAESGNQREGELAVDQLLSSNLDQIEKLLVGYHFRTRGRVFGVEYLKESLRFNNVTEGHFQVNYFIGLFNACADLDHQEKQRMTITFKLLPDQQLLVLRGEFIPEREPDEF